MRGAGTTEAILKQKRDLFDVLLEAAGGEGEGEGEGEVDVFGGNRLIV